MQRDDWKFNYTSSALAQAALNKMTHHTERKKFWQETYENVVKEIKAAGIDVSESSADYSSVSNKLLTPQVMVSADLQRKLSEAFQKIKIHDGLISQYDSWYQMLNANPSMTLEADLDDYMFFYGK